MTQPIIGFIGLGIMGRPMSGHLLKAGYALVVYDVVRQAVVAAVEAGASEAASPKEVAERSDVLITMLPDSPDVEAVALGPGGLIEGVRPGMLYADMSSIAPTAAVKVATALGRKGRALPGRARQRRRRRRDQRDPLDHGRRRRGGLHGHAADL